MQQFVSTFHIVENLLVAEDCSGRHQLECGAKCCNVDVPVMAPENTAGRKKEEASFLEVEG